MKLTITKSDVPGFSEDWWLIERAEHEGREWFEPIPGGYSFESSARVSDADVEGTSAEMHSIAEAIEQRGTFRARRCAVQVYSISDGQQRAVFWSPRNSRNPGTVTLEEADDLARQIRERVPRAGAQR